MPIRSIVRVTGVATYTIAKLPIDLGVACSLSQDRVLRDLPCRVLE
jgi:hypothetical protein